MSSQEIRISSNKQNYRLFAKKYGILFITIGVAILLSIFTPKFLSVGNITNVLNTVSINGILALGMVFVMTAGGIDLSVGALLALASTTIGVVLNATGNDYLACLVAVMICSLFGLLNGVLIAKFNMFPFVVTLASQLVIRGFGYVLSGGYSFALKSASFTQIGLGRLWGTIPYPVLYLLVIAIFAYIIMHHTKYGRFVYAVGGNINTARASGINVKWTQIGTYVISGFCAGVAGVILTTRINAAQPNIGIGYETDAIAACVLGGTSFAGGISTIPGTFLGIIFIGIMYNGMNLIGIESYWQTIVKGLVIIGAVLLDTLFNKRES